jgi:hypothetical protein
MIPWGRLGFPKTPLPVSRGGSPKRIGLSNPVEERFELTPGSISDRHERVGKGGAASLLYAKPRAHVRPYVIPCATGPTPMLIRNIKIRPSAVRVAAAIAAATLLLGVFLIIGAGDTFHRITGIPRSEPLTPPDEVKSAVHDDPLPFLVGRDRLDVRVDVPMTVRQVLDNNRLNKPNLQRQVLEQLSNPSLDSTVDAGVTLHLSLTPAASDVPATTPPRAPR